MIPGPSGIRAEMPDLNCLPRRLRNILLRSEFAKRFDFFTFEFPEGAVRVRIPVYAWLGFLVAAFLPAAAPAQTSCEALANLTLTNATITSAQSMAGGEFKPPA